MNTQATINNDRYDAYQLEGLGGTLAFGKVPSGDVSGSAHSRVQSALEKVLALDAAIRQAAANKELSAVGRANKLKPQQAEVLAYIAAKIDAVQQERDALRDTEDKVLGAPSLASDDAVGALRDREIRERLPRLAPEARGKLWQEVGQGQHADIVNAMLRDPLPSVERENWTRLARETAAAQNPGLVRAWQSKHADLDWCEGALQAMAQKVRDGLSHGVGASA